MPSQNIYEIIQDSLQDSNTAFEATKLEMTFSNLADTFSNTSDMVKNLYSNYKDNTNVKDNETLFLALQGILATGSIISNFVANLNKKEAYEKGPNGLVVQYINSLIHSGSLDPAQVEEQLMIAGKIDAKGQKQLSPGAVQKSKDQAEGHSADAQKAADDAKLYEQQAKAIKVQIQQLLNSLEQQSKQDLKTANTTVEQIKKLLADAQASNPNGGQSS